MFAVELRPCEAQPCRVTDGLVGGEIACDNTSTTVCDTSHFHSTQIPLISSTIVRFVLKRHAISEFRQLQRDLFVGILQLWLPDEGSFKEDLCPSWAPNETLQVAHADAPTTPSFVLLHLEHLIPSVSHSVLCRLSSEPHQTGTVRIFIMNKHQAIDASVHKHNTVFFLLFYAQGNNEPAYWAQSSTRLIHSWAPAIKSLVKQMKTSCSSRLWCASASCLIASGRYNVKKTFHSIKICHDRVCTNIGIIERFIPSTLTSEVSFWGWGRLF